MFKNYKEKLEELENNKETYKELLEGYKAEMKKATLAFYVNRSITDARYKEIMDYYEGFAKICEKEITKLQRKIDRMNLRFKKFNPNKNNEKENNSQLEK